MPQVTDADVMQQQGQGIAGSPTLPKYLVKACAVVCCVLVYCRRQLPWCAVPQQQRHGHCAQQDVPYIQVSGALQDNVQLCNLPDTPS
jgi:hypothetical protein